MGSLRIAISSGAVLADSTRTAFRGASGIELMDSLASTEMMQTFISHAPQRGRRGATGYAVPGFRAVILDDEGKVCPPNVTGRLAVKGPTGCLYLGDSHQSLYVRDGWNIAGDAYSMDRDGYFYFQGGSDDTIVSAGDAIAGIEVEAALLGHQAVADCGVIGIPDELRGQLVAAFVVLKPGFVAGAQLVTELQNYVKVSIASHKYPRRIEFVSTIPRTEVGTMRRFKLLELAAGSGGA
jgi:2-aminobenzoate-CoA ligase